MAIEPKIIVKSTYTLKAENADNGFSFIKEYDNIEEAEFDTQLVILAEKVWQTVYDTIGYVEEFDSPRGEERFFGFVKELSYRFNMQTK